MSGVVIVGAGMAGGNAACLLREEGYEGSVSLITDEPGFPFGRPPLSKTYLRGVESLDGWLVTAGDWYAAHEIDIIRDAVARIDVRQQRVALRSGRELEYTQLVVATGGRNRRLTVPGADLEGIHQLRTVAECDGIKSEVRRGARAVIIGMGFIGSEVAASLRQLGVSVTAVFPGDAPLDTVLGSEMGGVMAAIHRDNGVQLVPHDQVARFEGNGRVERVVTGGGRSLECDFVVAAVGIQPNVDLLQGTGIAIDNGVLVDRMLRTNVAGVFAAGDVANHDHALFGRVRVEHYNNAEKQGRAVARSMLRGGEEYAYLHTFWSDQYQHKLEYAGHATRWDRFVVRGSLDGQKLVGFYLVDGVVRAAVGLDRGGDPELEPDSEMAKAARLIAKGARPSPEQLADEDNDLALL